MAAGTIDPATFTLETAGDGITVVGSVTYNSLTQTATFAPASPLSLDTLYTATMTTGAQDPSGIGLTADRTWSFGLGNLSWSGAELVESDDVADVEAAEIATSADGSTFAAWSLADGSPSTKREPSMAWVPQFVGPSMTFMLTNSGLPIAPSAIRSLAFSHPRVNRL